MALFKKGNTSLNKRASLGLRVITTIASASSHRTVTAETLATVNEVSRSYIEGILKDAKEFGLIDEVVMNRAKTVDLAGKNIKA